MLRLVGIHTDYDFEPGRKSRGRFHWYKLVGSSAKQLLFQSESDMSLRSPHRHSAPAENSRVAWEVNG